MAVIGGIIAAVAPYVAVAGTAVSIGTGVASANRAADAQEQGARDAQRLAEMNAMAQERESAQAADNLAKSQGQEEARNRAKASASGVSGDGSFQTFMDDQMNTNAQQLAWLKNSGASQADIIREQGQSAYNVGMSNAKTTKIGIGNTVVGGVSDVYGTASSAGWLST